MALELRSMAQQAGDPKDIPLASAGDTSAASRLFTSAAEAVSAGGIPDLAVTLYGAGDQPLAWAGRPTQLPADRLQAAETWFLTPGELDRRLVYVRSVTEGAGRGRGAIAAERPLSMLTRGDAGASPCADREAFCFPTRLGAVTIELPIESGRTSEDQGDRFDVQAPSGEHLLTASVRPDDLALTRERWRRATSSLALMVAALTLLLTAGPLLDWRNQARSLRTALRGTVATAAVVIAGRIVLMAASPADWADASLFSSATYASSLLPRLLTSPLDFLLTALTAATLVALALYAIEIWRLRGAGRRLSIESGPRLLAYFATQLGAGIAFAIVLLGHEALLGDTIAQTSLDLVHFSLQPWDVSRTALQIGLIVLHATVAGLCVLVLRAALLRWRLPRRDWRLRVATVACWIVPLVLWQAGLGATTAQRAPMLAAAAIVVLIALSATRLSARYRHGSQAFRLTLLTLALVVPSFAFYPALFQLAGTAKAQLVETRFAEQALTLRRRLQDQLEQSLRDIDRIPDLAELTAPVPANTEGINTDRAFRVWQDTALAYPITSSVELYDPSGRLVSRFAFSLPEDLTRALKSEEDSCDWEVYGEVAPFFAEERPMLHAGRDLCRGGPSGPSDGSIVVHVMLDYENLPFISSRSPYQELLRPADVRRGEEEEETPYGQSGRDVEFAFYGWTKRPLYPTSEPAWQLDDDVRARLDGSREAFWQQLPRGDELFNVFLQNDRGGIYALGFPVVTPLGHLVNLAELTVLAVVSYLLLLTGNAVFGALSRRAMTAPALLREVRASFYRKLFIAFVAAVILPVGALALATRNYVGDEMRSTVEREAVRTASTAKSIVEDLITPGRTPGQLDVALDDNLMVRVSRLIDQDANVFEGPWLAATSERNLFASGLLPTRAPADVYRALQLRSESAVVTPERVGTFEEYLVAATTLTGRHQGAMLTVPLTSQQQDIETRIATLNRRMLLGALLFILAGAGLGYSMAERISDPVNRLTRATRRISRGDLDARILARSSDELRRLVDDFNSMAAELQRQRKELERTHRLEAWAEMARQVAHEIKNPLTPIQLTAEHLRRVHADRGEPLSPVLQDCVSTILSQVRLLRQIASEFSSFASSPTARPAVVDVHELVDEMIEPYRIGVQDRVRFEVEVPDTLPAVFVDRTLITRSLTNIVENALHAMPGRGTLTIAASGEDHVVRIRVSDTGVGMDAEALARAFEPYFSTKASGTGLGLAIARRNIELNGGTIAVASERDRGTTVEMTLPISNGT
jgi:signal transduction histidine kinase